MGQVYGFSEEMRGRRRCGGLVMTATGEVHSDKMWKPRRRGASNGE